MNSTREERFSDLPDTVDQFLRGPYDNPAHYFAVMRPVQAG